MATDSRTEDAPDELYKFLKERDENKVNPVTNKSLEYWNKSANRYDKNYNGGVSFKHVKIGAREFNKHLKSIEAPKNTKIADIGTGTGLIGHELKQEYEFSNMTAFDFSPCMLEKAKEKNAYNDLVVCDIHVDEMIEYHEQFDHAISIGCFVVGIIKPEALEKLVRLVKPGGMITISFREKNFDNQETGYRVKLEEMEELGVWKKVDCVLDEYMCLGSDPIRAYYVTLRKCFQL